MKTGNVKAKETWVGSLFQTRDAVDEKILKWPLMFSSMVQIIQIWLKRSSGVIVKVCISRSD